MFFRHNIAAILWSLLILVLCGIPGSDLPDLSVWDLISLDKLAHLSMFALLTLFCIVGFRKQNAFRILRIHAKRTALLYGLSLSVLTELLQVAVFIERSGDWYDVVANVLGCFVGVLLFRIVYGKELYYRVAG